MVRRGFSSREWSISLTRTAPRCSPDTRSVLTCYWCSNVNNKIIVIVVILCLLSALLEIVGQSRKMTKNVTVRALFYRYTAVCYCLLFFWQKNTKVKFLLNTFWWYDSIVYFLRSRNHSKSLIDKTTDLKGHHFSIGALCKDCYRL